MRSRILKTTVLAAAAGAIWTQMPHGTWRLNSGRRLSLKCWFMGHEEWIRRSPDRLYLECFECGRKTHGWMTGKSHPVDPAGEAFKGARMIKQKDNAASVRSPMRPAPRSDYAITHQATTRRSRHSDRWEFQ